MSCFSIQKTFVLLSLVFLAIAGLAQAGERMTLEERRQEKKSNNPIVIELFTTSDCIACAAADRLLYESMKDTNVIALSCRIADMSVIESNGDMNTNGGDGSSEGPMDPCVFRQWAYMSNGITRDVTIHVPLFIFNGSDRINANNLNLYDSLFNSYHYVGKNKLTKTLVKWKDEDTISIYLPQNTIKQISRITAGVWLVRYKDILIEKVAKGENKDRVVRFSNVVQSVRHVGKWYGVPRLIEVDVPKPVGGHESGGYVVLVGEIMGSDILSAGRLKDYTPIKSSP